MAAKTQTIQLATPETARQLFESLWAISESHKDAILLCLDQLSQNLGNTQPTTKAAAGYLAVLSPLTREELVLAFSRAVEELRYFPAPAILRELSGRPPKGDPLAAEAKAELLCIVAGMRGPWGPKLNPILGKVLYGTADKPLDEHGKLTTEINGLHRRHFCSLGGPRTRW